MMSRTCRKAALLSILLCAVSASAADAQTGANIVVITNALSKVSDQVGDYYARTRGVPSDQVLRLNIPVAEEVSRAVYEAQIERPLRQWLTIHSAQDRILYLVLAKDVPLRVAGTGGLTGTVASVDSELTLLYRKLSGKTFVAAGSIDNPYFLGESALSTAKPFTHRWQDLYLVSRLDGYTVADVKGLIDRCTMPSQEGVVLLDGRLEVAQSVGNKWLINAAAVLKKQPGWSDRVMLDTSGNVLREQSKVLGYYSWGSNDRTVTVARHLNNHFIPGALAGEFVSTDARTFVEPPKDWELNNPNKPFRGSHQSLIGDLIRDGITGVAGHVAEPYLNGTIRPDILFPAYTTGFNLIESFYLAMPFVSWQTVVVGDPLCAPFRTKALAAGDIDPGIDRSTELPQFLSDRRVGALTSLGMKPDAAKLMVKSEVRGANGDLGAAREALEQATVLDDRFVPAHLALAGLYEAARDWDKAADQYRRVIATTPNDAQALNNLAWLLATRKNDPAQALSFAKRAYTLPKPGPEAVDTLAWVQHLLGNDADAEPLIADATRLQPGNAEIHFHAAAILAAVGNAPGAARELETAVRLNPTFGDRADVQDLRARMNVPK
jgi:uncharacterized protein (TIGR03790 family)